MKLISDDARDLIVAEEVSSKAIYEKRYQRPEWPGGSSGVTIGIGYDVGAGVGSAAQFRADWGTRIPADMIEALVPCIGVTGERASAMLSAVRSKVSVPWDAAIAVFDDVDVPRWYNRCKSYLPNFDSLPPDCKGALVSLAYNRGASFTRDGDRYREMRAIRTHMAAKNLHLIPGEFRSMKRLWASTSLKGLVYRREHEALLFEKGLKAPLPAPAKIPQPPDVPTPEPATQDNWLVRLLNLISKRK